MAENPARQLDETESFDRLFALVKEAVFRVTGLRRAGLSLGLADLPPGIAAYHPFASNAIVLNRALLKAVNKVAKSKREVNAFLFVVLMHEYLHSLGILEEKQVRPLVQSICAKFLGEDHPASEMAKRSLYEIYPGLLRHLEYTGPDVELVKDFDRSTLTYLG
ncbi:MAG: hypothetical protein C4339_03900 [Nitrososphaerota archaeon]